MIKPISDGLGRMVSSTIHPLIYGANGEGGIAGVFKGFLGGEKQGQLKGTVDNTTATQQNLAHLAALTAILAGTIGVPAPALASTPAAGFSVPAMAMMVPGAGSAVQAATMSLPAAWGGGGITNVPVLMNGSTGGSPLAAIFGAGGGGGASPITGGILSGQDPTNPYVMHAVGGSGGSGFGGFGFSNILRNTEPGKPVSGRSRSADAGTGMAQTAQAKWSDAAAGVCAR